MTASHFPHNLCLPLKSDLVLLGNMMNVGEENRLLCLLSCLLTEFMSGLCAKLG